MKTLQPVLPFLAPRVAQWGKTIYEVFFMFIHFWLLALTKRKYILNSKGMKIEMQIHKHFRSIVDFLQLRYRAYSKVSIKHPGLSNNLVWTFPKSLYLTTRSISEKINRTFLITYLLAVSIKRLVWIFGKSFY